MLPLLSLFFPFLLSISHAPSAGLPDRKRTEVRVSHIRFKKKAVRKIVRYFEKNRQTESLIMGLGNKRPDPMRPGWFWTTVLGVIIPEDSDYEARSPVYLHMKRSFWERTNRALDEARANGKEYVVVLVDHHQPVDDLSGQDIDTGFKLANYLPYALVGSHNRFHRFFRLAGDSFEIVSWDVEDHETYSRQEMAFGNETQRRIASTRVLIVGAGGVGSKIFIDLAMMGYGVVDVVDPDKVELSNLARMPLSESSVNHRKVDELIKFASKLRTNTLYTGYPTKIQLVNPELFKKYDVVICAPDNTPCRRYVNDQCLRSRVPCIQIGSGFPNGTEAISCRTVVGGWTPCWECWKDFSAEEMKRDYYTEEQKQMMKKHGYGLPRPVPAIVTLNSLAAGYAQKALFRLITKQQLIPYVYLDLTDMTLKTYSEKRDPGCHACSDIPDYDLTFLEPEA
jgi:molybdopterin/thiamine biosynthesis adenylyltransferase